MFNDTVNAYVNVIQTQQVLQLNINNEQVLTRQLQATNDRFRVGEITRTDVAQAEAALAGARATRQTAEGNLATARGNFRRYVGELPDQLVEPQPLKLPVKNEQEAVQLAAQNNPNVIAALFDDAAAKDAIDVAFAQLMPQVSLQAQAARSDNSTDRRPAHHRRHGAAERVGADLPGRRRILARPPGPADRAAGAQDGRRHPPPGDRRRRRRRGRRWSPRAPAIESTRAQIRANEIALEGVQREAIVGSRTTLDVLNAEQTLLNSRVTLVQNLASLITASYTLAASIGRLTARDLNLNVPLYDETAYYNAVRRRLFGTGDYATSQPGRLSMAQPPIPRRRPSRRRPVDGGHPRLHPPHPERGGEAEARRQAAEDVLMLDPSMMVPRARPQRCPIQSAAGDSPRHEPEASRATASPCPNRVLRRADRRPRMSVRRRWSRPRPPPRPPPRSAR